MMPCFSEFWKAGILKVFHLLCAQLFLFCVSLLVCACVVFSSFEETFRPTAEQTRPCPQLASIEESRVKSGFLEMGGTCIIIAKRPYLQAH